MQEGEGRKGGGGNLVDSSSSGISRVKAVQTGFTSADGEHPRRGGRHVEFGRNFAERRRGW